MTTWAFLFWMMREHGSPPWYLFTAMAWDFVIGYPAFSDFVAQMYHRLFG